MQCLIFTVKSDIWCCMQSLGSMTSCIVSTSESHWKDFKLFQYFFNPTLEFFESYLYIVTIC
jgi:hypothetical protein